MEISHRKIAKSLTFKLIRRISISVFALGFTGCGTTILSSRTTNPVIQDIPFRWLSDSSTLSTTASRRLALMAYKKNEGSTTETLMICAEPPPDVGETFAKAFAAQLEASVPKAEGSFDASGSVATQVATSIAPLMVRSQGLQVLRDSAYTLCVDKLNGWLSEKEYIRMKDERFHAGIDLIKLQLSGLPAIGGTVPAPALPQTTAAAPASAAASATPAKAGASAAVAKAAASAAST